MSLLLFYCNYREIIYDKNVSLNRWSWKIRINLTMNFLVIPTQMMKIILTVRMHAVGRNEKFSDQPLNRALLISEQLSC